MIVIGMTKATKENVVSPKPIEIFEEELQTW